MTNLINEANTIIPYMMVIIYIIDQPKIHTQVGQFELSQKKDI